MPFDGQIGALEVGVLTAVFLFGITTTQTYLYYHLFPHDPKRTRQLVAIVWVLELATSISATHVCYTYTVTRFGNNNVPHMKLPPTVGVNLFLSEIVFVLVQSYFLLRITQVSRTWFFTVGCAILLSIRFVITTFAAVEALLTDTLDQFLKQWNWAIITFLTIGAFLDVVVPFGLVYFLYVQRAVAYKTTVLIVDKLILWTVETGIATGLLAVLVLIMYLALPGRFAWICVYACLPKLFSNALLANLNSRVKLRAMQEGSDAVEMASSDPTIRNTVHFPHRLGAKVTVSTQRVRTIDDGLSKPVDVEVEEAAQYSGDGTPSSTNDRKDTDFIIM
ncbi:hypothetical protein E1B28_002302 [Marasmius oreades]|uniref:DUF6534 domain-containing protein n=1 Tax=Marasmius oreades TaxID=181124 RepID=A0A9P7RMR4_9AGAR|nr:uncharacterized protein E1B28_002302 [Marasmius oreades]KAG7086340.1 hypothetical protein E1B28_002302 [Marasmius oreades]